MLAWLKSNHQALTAIGAMIVGLAALFIAWDQAQVMRRQQHGAVLPAIQLNGFVQENDGLLAVGLRMRNNGVGPALIHDFTLEVDGALVESWDEFTALAPEGANRSWTSIVGRVLGPGEEITAIELSWTEIDPANIEALLDFVNSSYARSEVEICYCSVFDRCYVSSSSSTDNELPREVPTCRENSNWREIVEVTRQEDQEDTP